MLGIDGYEPQWHHDARTLAAANRARFAPLIGQPLVGSWVMWDVVAGAWFTGGPVVLGFPEANVEITHRKFDECAITRDQVDLSRPVAWPGLALDWRAGTHPAVARAHGRPLRAVNIIERLMSAPWRPVVLHAVELLFDGARLAVFNALDENGITGADEVDLPVGHWRRVRVAGHGRGPGDEHADPSDSPVGRLVR